jgi:membrane-bound lytic murein transglycosylase D
MPSVTVAPAPPAAGAPDSAALQDAPPVDSVTESPELREDLWARVRRHYAIDDLDNDRVRRWEQFYLSRPDYLERMFERGGLYLFHIVEEVVRRGLPTELALLPFIESAFNPLALSSAKASGIWQFMPATGRHFELRQNLFRDDRRSVLDSTRAALDYLQQLHGMFGDWHLALAAYNWGQGNVARAQAGNRRRGRGTGYLDLAMPDETRNYVPKLQAIVNLVGNPERYGLTLPRLENHPYFLTVTIDRDIDVELVARLAGVTVDDFRALNPQHNKPVILAAGTPQLLLPFDNARRFRAELERHQGPFASWTAWVAPRTLNVRDAARSTGMDEDDLRTLNRIPPGMVIKAGSTLLVARGASTQGDVPGHVAETATIALASERPAAGQRVVKAGPKGESVSALARRYRVSAAQLAAWNGLSVDGRLLPGQRVVLQGAAVASRTAAPRPGKAAPPVRQAGPRGAQPRSERGRVQAAPAGRAVARSG